MRLTPAGVVSTVLDPHVLMYTPVLRAALPSQQALATILNSILVILVLHGLLAAYLLYIINQTQDV